MVTLVWREGRKEGGKERSPVTEPENEREITRDGRKPNY